MKSHKNIFFMKYEIFLINLHLHALIECCDVLGLSLEGIEDDGNLGVVVLTHLSDHAVHVLGGFDEEGGDVTVLDG